MDPTNNALSEVETLREENAKLRGRLLVELYRGLSAAYFSERDADRFWLAEILNVADIGEVECDEQLVDRLWAASARLIEEALK